MGSVKKYLKIFLWLLFFITFSVEFVKIVFELSPTIGHQKLGMANAFFWSSLFLLEIIMAGMALYFLIKYPARRKRLVSLALFHFSFILLIPVVLNNWSWTCVLYPWPHSLQAFDPATPGVAFFISMLVGFVAVPFLTYRWGAAGFCGYVCPHGAFFSETYGRVFPSRPNPLQWAAKLIPPLLFYLMTCALLIIAIAPVLVVPLRSVQKLVYFFTAEYFYFVIGIPLLGGRSYCRLICPMGYWVRLMVRFKRRLKAGMLNPRQV
jgi:polyferredoxin